MRFVSRIHSDVEELRVRSDMDLAGPPSLVGGWGRVVRMNGQGCVASQAGRQTQCGDVTEPHDYYSAFDQVAASRTPGGHGDGGAQAGTRAHARVDHSLQSLLFHCLHENIKLGNVSTSAIQEQVDLCFLLLITRMLLHAHHRSGHSENVLVLRNNHYSSGFFVHMTYSTRLDHQSF